MHVPRFCMADALSLSVARLKTPARVLQIPYERYARARRRGARQHFGNRYNGSMNSTSAASHARSLTSFFRSGDVMRSRSVSDLVLTTTLDVPVPGAPVLADWQRETSTRLALEPGDVEVMPLARTQVRWPEYKRCVQAMSDWLCALGLPDVLADSDMALMACRGARYHHDAEQYGAAAFCNRLGLFDACPRPKAHEPTTTRVGRR
jgi:hypothetical protein